LLEREIATGNRTAVIPSPATKSRRPVFDRATVGISTLITAVLKKLVRKIAVVDPLV
jgi:hypothetical protein